MEIEKKTIAQVAISYIGQTEKQYNSGFSDPDFEKEMKAVGWQIKQAWCAYFCELCAIKAHPEKRDELIKLFSGHVLTCFRNFQSAGKIVDKPQVNDLAVWQLGRSAQGHMGVVIAVNDNEILFSTVEGNTNDKGGREGYIVAKKNRNANLKFNPNILNLLGFIRI